MGQQLKSWGGETFGHIPKKIGVLQECISYLNTLPVTSEHICTIRSLEHQLNHFLSLEEYYWKQRSRADWLQGSDKNTKFFHHKASSRRRNNFIRGILSDQNEWVTDAK